MSNKSSKTTPSQVWGPFYVQHAPFRCRLAPIGALGTPLIIKGQVRSVDGSPLCGIVIDLWQASGVQSDDTTGGVYDYYEPDGKKHEYKEQLNQHGAAKEYAFRARLLTSPTDGTYELHTVMPSAYFDPDDGLWRCPHIHFFVQPNTTITKSNGQFDDLVTQLYFKGASPYNDTDKHILPELTIETEKQKRTREDGTVFEYLQGQFDIVLEKKK